MIRGAPNKAKALQLAARLRRAGRDGRALKNGLQINVEDVDEAVDVLLENSQRHKQSVIYEDEYQQKRGLRKEAPRQDTDDPVPDSAWVDTFDEPGNEFEQPASRTNT